MQQGAQTALAVEGPDQCAAVVKRVLEAAEGHGEAPFRLPVPPLLGRAGDLVPFASRDILDELAADRVPRAVDPGNRLPHRAHPPTGEVEVVDLDHCLVSDLESVQASPAVCPGAGLARAQHCGAPTEAVRLTQPGRDGARPCRRWR
jgi:hypothetical protein